MTLRIIIALGALALLLFASPDETKKTPGDPAETQRDALAKLQPYVGTWRGVGQVRRGSSAGAWTEQAEVAWRIKPDSASIVATSPKAKFFKAMSFRPLENGRFQMAGDSPGRSEEVRYTGKLDKEILELAADKPAKGLPDRIKIRLAASGKRLVVLYERKDGSRFSRMAEVGFTRRGSGFAAGSTGIECIVTGGTGTIPVRFEGKTYYVCCSGCKEYFDDDPAKTMREYRERKKAEREEKEGR